MRLPTIISARGRATKLVAVFAVVATAATIATVSAVAQGRHPADNNAHVEYTTSVSTHIGKNNSSIAFAASKFTAVLHQNGSLSGALPIPNATTRFKVIGLLPVFARVTLTQVGAVTGKLHANATTTVSATAHYTLKLFDVTVAGQAANVGSSCQTVTPLAVNVATPKHKQFNLTGGGVLSGTYTIGKLTGCGMLTGLITQLVSGTHNTISLHLSKGHIS